MTVQAVCIYIYIMVGEFKHLLVPLWILESNKNGTQIQAAINGLKLSPNCSPGTFHPNFIQILHQTCIVCKVENGYCIMKLDPRIIHVLQLWYLNFYWKIIQAWYNPVSVDFWCYIYKILKVITITNGTSKKSSFNSEYFY